MSSIGEEILKYLKNEMTQALELCINEDAELYVVDSLWPECGLRGVNNYEVYFSERRIGDYGIQTCCEVRFNPQDSVLKTIMEEPLCFIFVQSGDGEIEKVCIPGSGIKVVDLDKEFLSIVPDNISMIMEKMIPVFNKTYQNK